MTNGKPYLSRRLISQPILEEIADLHRDLVGNLFYDQVLKQKEVDSMFQESVINSARLEAELLKILANRECDFFDGVVSKRRLQEDAEEIGDRVNEAWKWAAENFTGEFSENFICQIGNIVEPLSNPLPKLRVDHVRVGDKGTFSPEKLRMYFPVLLDELNGNFVYCDSMSVVHGKQTAEEAQRVTISPVEKAAYAHLMNFIYQPLADGNKRTGRILQNLILMNEKLPPAVIRGTESKDYIKLLCSAREGFENRRADNPMGALTSGEEHEFYDFVGRKVVDSLHTLGDKLADKKAYLVVVYPKSSKYEEGVYRTVKQAFTSLMRKRGPQSGQVRLTENGLIVKGNISKAELGAVLDTMPAVKDHKFFPVPGHYNKK